MNDEELRRQRERRSIPERLRVPSWLQTLTAWTWRLLVVLIGVSAILVMLIRLYIVTLPVVVALVLATLCVPVARWLEAHGAHRMVAASTVVFGGIAAFAGIIAALTPAFVREVRELGPTVGEALDTVLLFLEDNFGWDRAEVLTMFDEGMQALSEQSGRLASQVLSGATIAVQSVTALVLSLVLLFFFVKDGAQIVDWFLARTPPTYRDTVRAVGRRAWFALTGFIRGTALVALVDALGIGIGLAIVGVPLVLPIAVLVFLASFIPIIGAFVTGLLAMLVALATGGFQQAMIVLAIVLGVQQLESNVLQPVIMRRAVNLHPVVILTALAAGATLIGVLGAFLAVPVAAVAAAVGNELRLRHEARLRTGAATATASPPTAD
ncbi:MAG: AI-2E family transporter [Nitriliruptoraceae bacterium]